MSATMEDLPASIRLKLPLSMEMSWSLFGEDLTMFLHQSWTNPTPYTRGMIPNTLEFPKLFFRQLSLYLPLRLE